MRTRTVLLIAGALVASAFSPMLAPLLRFKRRCGAAVRKVARRGK